MGYVNPKAHAATPYTDTITGLTPGAIYDVRVTFVDWDGVYGANPQLFSAEMAVQTTAGTATAVVASDTTIEISMPYSGDGNANNAYKVEYKPSSFTWWLDWGTNPKAHTASPYTDTITDLVPAASYDVRLTYIDTDGVSGTNPQTISPQAKATTTGPATAVAVSGTAIEISMPYTADENSNNTYTVEYRLNSSVTWLAWGVNPKAHATSPYTDTITGLTPGCRL